MTLQTPEKVSYEAKFHTSRRTKLIFSTLPRKVYVRHHERNVVYRRSALRDELVHETLFDVTVWRYGFCTSTFRNHESRCS